MAHAWQVLVRKPLWLPVALGLCFGALPVFAQDQPRFPSDAPEHKTPKSKAAPDEGGAPRKSSKANDKSSEPADPVYDARFSEPPPIDTFEMCLQPDEVEDKDGDFTRNKEALSSSKLCIKQHIFREGQFRWVLQIVQNTKMPKTAFWFIPHDNENSAFDTGVYAVTKYGGTLVAVETGGNRYNGKQDPNRNFDANTGLKCPLQIQPSPLYTENVTRWRIKDGPIIALHTNTGKGGISITHPLPGPKPFASPEPLKSKSPDHTVLFVASTRPAEEDPALAEFVKDLNNNGIHVLYETVSREKNDCSFSNYAALAKVRNYVNLEVVEGDGASQRKMLDRVWAVWKQLPNGGVAPLPVPAHPPKKATKRNTSASSTGG